MKTAHLESAFESEIVDHLVQHSWHQGGRQLYRRDLGLDPSELLAFVQATQPQSWGKLVALHGSTGQGPAAAVQADGPTAHEPLLKTRVRWSSGCRAARAGCCAAP
jgi:hypothetical protein